MRRAIMTNTLDPARRKFLKDAAVASGGLVIGFYWPGAARVALAQTSPAPIPPNAFIRIAPDSTVTVLIKHLEFGQGVFTSLPMIVAEELDCDWAKVRAEHAPAAPAYVHTAFGIQMTGGSTSVANSWDQLRVAGAQARAMLVQAAAARWGVSAAECRTANGFVTGPGNRRIAYGALADEAAKLPPPDPKSITLKDPKAFKLIGKPTRRIDARAKSNGSAQFGIDHRMPNMATALVARPPVFGGKVVSFDAARARAVPGVIDVVQIPQGVAVLASGYWPAKQGRDVLTVQWDDGPGAKLSSESLRAEYLDLAGKPGTVAKRAGDAADALGKAAKTVSADYEFPYLAHAPMEPLNCAVDLQPERCRIWTGTQFQTMDQMAAAKVAGLKPEQVEITTLFAGGGFGRRANPASDYIVEAVEVAKAAKRPVKVVWSREDDIRGGYYRPMYVHRVSAGIDASGRASAWQHTLVGQSILAGTAFEQFLVKDGIDATSVEGVADMPYDIPNLLASLHSPRHAVPVLWWRSVGHTHTAFVVETMIDELAALAGKDPVAFRRELLAKHPRELRTLDLAVERSGYGKRALAPGRALGVAVHESFDTVCAQVAEVSVAGNQIRVHRVTAAVDCGIAINPAGVQAQVESAIAYGLTAAFNGAITLKDGRVEQSNFNDYAPLRLPEMPAVDVHIVPSAEKPTGLGEPGTPPIAPAVANAVFRLTGKRLRKLPFTLA
jgi:isoquinoline 1-oxidoreductase subunit beta